MNSNTKMFLLSSRNERKEKERKKILTNIKGDNLVVSDAVIARKIFFIVIKVWKKTQKAENFVSDFLFQRKRIQKLNEQLTEGEFHKDSRIKAKSKKFEYSSETNDSPTKEALLLETIVSPIAQKRIHTKMNVLILLFFFCEVRVSVCVCVADLYERKTNNIEEFKHKQ